MNRKPVVCFFTLSSGNWGGASRVLYTALPSMDRSRMTPLLILPSSGPIESELERHDLRYMVWGPLTEPGDIPTYLQAFFRAWRLFRRERIAVIHINGSNFWRPAELLAAWVLRIPIIAHYHVVNDEPGPFMKLCRAAICVSRYTADHSLPARLSKPLIYNSIDLARFDAGRSLRQDLGLTPEHIVVSFLGQIREIKGIADFIAMAHKIANPHVRFLIAGECRDPAKFSGSYSEDDLRRMAGEDDRVRYIGYVKEVENVYHTSDIIVVPSRWQEPLGLINLEAGACRKPVVATRVGGVPEVIHDGVNGYLVDPGDTDSMAAKVTALINDVELRRRMGDAGRRQVEEYFTGLPIRHFETLLFNYANHA